MPAGAQVRLFFFKFPKKCSPKNDFFVQQPVFLQNFELMAANLQLFENFHSSRPSSTAAAPRIAEILITPLVSITIRVIDVRFDVPKVRISTFESKCLQLPLEAVRRNKSKLRGVERKAYYSYTVFKSLVVDRRIIQALDFPVRELMWSPPTTLKDISFLDEKIVNNPDQGRMRTLVMDQEEHVQLSLWTTAMAWVGAGGWLLWAGCWILVWMERWTGGWAGLRVWMEECWSRRSWKEVEVELSEEEQED